MSQRRIKVQINQRKFYPIFQDLFKDENLLLSCNPNDPNDHPSSPFLNKYSNPNVIKNSIARKKKENKRDDFISSVQQLRYSYNPYQ